MKEITYTLPATLQLARKNRRLSQLDLALLLGVSQRHISFVESGRSRPSRALLMLWLRELAAPLSVRNAAFLQAGYAATYSSTGLNEPNLAYANEALLMLLKSHDPMPAMVFGAQWDLLHINSGAQWLAITLVPWASDLFCRQSANFLDMLVHPEGFTKTLINLDEVGPVFLSELRDLIAVQPNLAPKVEAFAQLLRDQIGIQPAIGSFSSMQSPMATLRFKTVYGELSFFRMFSTFGSPQDITLSSLRVEHMFAADEGTKAVILEHVKVSN